MTELKQGIFGIDLGTTYSGIAYIDGAGRPTVVRNSYGEDTTPSVVYFESETNVVVGTVAKDTAIMSPDSVVSMVKRQMGNRDYSQTYFGEQYTAPTISALILEALAHDAETETGRKVSDVVITVPAYFGMLEKEATRQAGEIAGLNVVGIVPEPVAAALSYGLDGGADGSTILVYDLGGGTFDVTIMQVSETEIKVLVVGGNPKLGGADWDKVLFEHLVDEVSSQVGDDSIRDDDHAMQEISTLAEKTKKQLTVSESRTAIIHQSGISAKVIVTRAQFEQMTAYLVDQTIEITKRTLAEAEALYPGVQAQITDVLLVGGSSWMPAVSTAIKGEFGWDAKLADPDLSVAKGAALYAAGKTPFLDLLRDQSDASAAGAGTDAAIRVGPHGQSAAATEAALEAASEAYGVDSERLRDLGKRSVVSAVPKAIGIKLIDAAVPNWQQLPEPPMFVEHLVLAQTSFPYTPPEPYIAHTVTANQNSIEIQIWEQAGAAAGREMHENRLLESGRIDNLASYSLPAGSPINIEFAIDSDGIVKVRATEPESGASVNVEARIAMLSDEQVENAKGVFAGLTSRT